MTPFHAFDAALRNVQQDSPWSAAEQRSREWDQMLHALRSYNFDEFDRLNARFKATAPVNGCRCAEYRP